MNWASIWCGRSVLRLPYTALPFRSNEMMLPIYYRLRGWDWETGKPLPEKLSALNLPEAVAALW